MPTLCCPPIGLAPIAAEDGRNWMSHLGLSPNRGIAQFLAIPMWFWSILIQTHSKAGLKLATRVAGLYRNLRNLHLVGLCKYWLVVWLPFFIFPYIGLLSSSQLTNSIIFQRGFSPGPPTRIELVGKTGVQKASSLGGFTPMGHRWGVTSLTISGTCWRGRVASRMCSWKGQRSAVSRPFFNGLYR